MMYRTLAIACLLLAGCSRPTTTADFGEYLDENTGTTVVHLREPAVYYRDAPTLAAHARDYVSLAPMELSQAGQRRYLLWVWRWSTIDRGGEAAAAEPRFVLLLDGEPMELPTSRPPTLVHSPYAPLVDGGQPAFYSLTRNQVARLGNANRTAVYLADGEGAGEYQPWRVARAELRAFARRIDALGAAGLAVASTDD